ncbi:MAG: YidC/Oxa1 family membrane protein insertase [Solirubrobacteraceae bacterium]
MPFAAIQDIIQPLIDVFESVLKFFHSAGVSWGFSIVLLTVVVRAIMIPLTLKQFRSMQAMQRLQPELKALQAKYKEDKQHLQQEMMKFYKENKVNPLGSCLPMVAQLPAFISLFYMLRTSLRHDICPKLNPVAHASHTVACGPRNGAGFLFIGDLTNNAAGVTLVVLILLYVCTQLGSSLLMSTPTMDKTQRKIMLLMPLAFVFFLIQYPAGLLVYWVTTNLWTIGQQYIVRRGVGPVPSPPLAVSATTTGGSDRRSAGSGPTGGASGRGGGGGGRGGGGPGKPKPRPAPENGRSNGSGGGGGLGGLLRGKLKTPDEPVTVGGGGRSRTTTAPPPSPRKKKKRSGRRR